MIKLQSFLYRRSDMTHEAFREYWLTEHVPLAKELPGLRRYRTALPIDPARAEHDGIAELYFDTVAAFEAALGPDSDTEAIRDVENFERGTDRHLVTETVHFDESGVGPEKYKHVAVLWRDPSLSHDAFVDAWHERAVPDGPRPDLRKYTTARPVDPDEATADLLVERYYRDRATLETALAEGSVTSVGGSDEPPVDRVTALSVEEIEQKNDLD